ncbi:MAG TPA: hypothetical protein VHZ74_12090 [Bryobacteraceae bacterium]|nr:hypothetical protein [Bryobacteraceae bacterium]
MKRSRAVDLVLLVSSVAALDGCGRKQCVDERDIVVNDGYCQSQGVSSGLHGYRYYSGGFFNSTPAGGSVRDSGTVRGIFGGSGEGAHGGGAGE